MKYYFLFIVLSFSICNSQETFEYASLGFSIKKPKDWITAEQGEVIKNLQRNVTLDSSTIKKLIENNKGTIEIVTYFKYPISNHAGVIPTIKVNLRYKGASTFAAFKNSIIKSYSAIKDIFPDFTFLTEPNSIVIDGKESVYSVSSYTLETINGEEKVKIWVYAIPVNDNFYQITFMDSEDEDNSLVFESIAQSIRIRK